ncbi:MAG: hypothetical protein H6Q61_456 [Firmicutes bacterium]|nr:hypothetical protein [Bacillota bacterium]
MIIHSNGPGGLPPVMKSLTYDVGKISNSRPQTVSGQFDQVNISPQNTRDGQFYQEFMSRLVGEIRTANTTGSVTQLKQEVQSGTYQPDPSEIATRLLLRGDSIETI